MSSGEVNLESFFIPLEKIKLATKNFSRENIIGEGGFGVVYKGELCSTWQNRTAAIKRKYLDGSQGENEFRNELKMMSIHNQNIISFIGYCDENKEMIIVYEYATNGSLDRCLKDPDIMHSMSWEQRLKICLGAAQGLKYLHSGLAGGIRIIHRDLKSSNILLDDDMVAKLSDFGLSRLGPTEQAHTEIHTRPAGTQFYLDPIYNESGILTKESDIYSFGVVLFEILSGMPVYCTRQIGDNEPQTLIKMVRRYADEDEQENIIDFRIIHQTERRSIDLFKEIAYKCISHNRYERPTIDGIIKTIEKALEFLIYNELETLTDIVDDADSKQETLQMDEISDQDPTLQRNELQEAFNEMATLQRNELQEAFNELSWTSDSGSTNLDMINDIYEEEPTLTRTVDNEISIPENYIDNEERAHLRSFRGFQHDSDDGTLLPTYIGEDTRMINTPGNFRKQIINNLLPKISDLLLWINIKAKTEAEEEIEEVLSLL